MKTNRGRDMKVEREIASFLDEHLYSQPIFTCHTRTDDVEQQLQGSDILLSIPSLGIENAIVDEKAISTYYYLPKSIPTFALELSFKSNRGDIIEGWFTDTSKITEYYLMVWIHATKYDFTKDDITWLEYALVRRSDIYKWLETQGLTKEKLREKDSIIRSTITQKGNIEKYDNKDYWFSYSPQLGECPINLVIRKKIYLKFALLHGEFSY